MTQSMRGRTPQGSLRESAVHATPGAIRYVNGAIHRRPKAQDPPSARASPAPVRADRDRDRRVLIFGAGRLGLLGFVLGPQVSGELAQARGVEPGERVLLVGNSLTWYNGMPQMIQGLADSDPGAPPMFVVSYTQDGATLQQLSGERRLSDLIAGVRWDDVVLQEQSELLSFTQPQYEQTTVPYARTLSARIAADGARTVLEMTWGYRRATRKTSPGTRIPPCRRGSSRATVSSAASSTPRRPVGLAWRATLWQRPGLDLWADGRHPNRAGSYLTACVLYAELSDHDPRGIPYTGGLDPAEARFFQRIAHTVT